MIKPKTIHLSFAQDTKLIKLTKSERLVPKISQSINTYEKEKGLQTHLE